MAEKKLVKVKILKWVGEYEPGQIIEVSEEKAASLCKPRHYHNGHEVVVDQKAMLLEDAEKLDKAEIDISKLTQKDMAELGLKNIVHTPKNGEAEKQKYAESVGAGKPKPKGGQKPPPPPPPPADQTQSPPADPAADKKEQK